MSTYKIKDNVNEWDFENGFYLTSQNNRLSDFISHLELYKMILNLPGDVLEFGVYKGSSFIQFLTFRQYYENFESRTIVGFDSFGKFPDDLELESDLSFVKRFNNDGGDSISKTDLDTFLKKKNFSNYNLIKGNILKTLPDYLMNNSQKKYSLVHIDVDVYEPTKFILDNIWDKIVRGGILILDDYGTVEGETKAVDEFINDKDIIVQKTPYKYKPSFIQKT
jgi:hypothetical protein